MIDLTQLPPPALLEALDIETLYATKVARFQTLYPEWSAVLESDPVVKLLELAAYDEAMLRARINDVAMSRLLAFAQGADLDHTVALLGVGRLLIDAGDPDAEPPRAALFEDDERLRFRGQMALEGTSVAGSAGAYRFHALSASAHVADVTVDAPRFAVSSTAVPGNIVLTVTYAAGLTDPRPGDVVLNVLAKTHDEASYAVLLPHVGRALNAEHIRPLTDHPHARAARAVHYRIDAVLELEDGPDPVVAKRAARERLDALLATKYKLNAYVPRSAVYAALHGPGMSRVLLREPAQDLMCGIAEFPWCDDITLTSTVS